MLRGTALDGAALSCAIGLAGDAVVARMAIGIDDDEAPPAAVAGVVAVAVFAAPAAAVAAAAGPHAFGVHAVALGFRRRADLFAGEVMPAACAGVGSGIAAGAGAGARAAAMVVAFAVGVGAAEADDAGETGVTATVVFAPPHVDLESNDFGGAAGVGVGAAIATDGAAACGAPLGGAVALGCSDCTPFGRKGSAVVEAGVAVAGGGVTAAAGGGEGDGPCALPEVAEAAF